MRKKTIYTKFIYIMVLTAFLIFLSGYFAVKELQTINLRNNAQTIVQHVLSFRAWIANTGVIWTDNLHSDFKDFLGKSVCNNDKTFYSKNPALATRELSEVYSTTGSNASYRVTSRNYRNPKNKPDSFELRAIDLLEKKEESYVETFENGMYRYSYPLVVTEACLKCHGNPDEAPKEVREKYGSDKAFGYKVGDVRGVITVNISKLSFFKMLAPIANPYTIILVVLGLLINFFLVKLVIVDRIKHLTYSADRMKQGKLHTQLSDRYEKDSDDEIDRLYHTVDLMKDSLRVLINKMMNQE